MVEFEFNIIYNTIRIDRIEREKKLLSLQSLKHLRAKLISVTLTNDH